jgi:hypothetical protein
MLDGLPRALSLSALLFSSLLLACGGSTPAADSPSSAEEGSSASGGDTESGSSDAAGDDGEGSAPAEPEKPRCDDGTCSPCGDALCPSGWYCDESAPGGPACGWLPECASKASCACVKRAFSGCSCEDQGGSAHVRCE